MSDRLKHFSSPEGASHVPFWKWEKEKETSRTLPAQLAGPAGSGSKSSPVFSGPTTGGWSQVQH